MAPRESETNAPAGTAMVDGIPAIRRCGRNFLDYASAALYLQTSQSTIQNRVWQGKLKPIRLGRRNYIDQGQLDRDAGFLLDEA